MNWRLLKAFPKYALVVGVLVISTGLFAAWWVFRSAGSPAATPVRSDLGMKVDVRREEVKQKAASLPQKMGWLALVGSDLYDVSTGELIFQNWLGGVPQKLFYQPATNRLMAQTERGVIRFATDGSKDGVMGEGSPSAFTHDGKQAMFVKGGDVWVADVDWKGFRLTNERQASKLGQFHPAFFAQNVMLGSDKALLVRLQGQLARVDLLTGEVQPQRIPVNDLAKRRSPDGRYLIGDDGKNIYVYDVEANDAKSFPKGRERVNDWQWLSGDSCGFILGGKAISVYDRKQGAITQPVPLPFACNNLVGPSPSGRYALCFGAGGILIVDFTEKRTIPFGTPAQDFQWLGEDTLLCSRDVPDTSVRGTWLKTIGGEERRVLEEPYIAGNGDAAAFALMREVSLVLVATRSELYRMNLDGSDPREIAKLARPVARIQGVEIWGK